MKLDRDSAASPQDGRRGDTTRRVGIWGHYHGGNQGDDLVVDTLIAAIRARARDADIVGFSLNPIDTRARHGIPTYPITPTAARNSEPTRVWRPDDGGPNNRTPTRIGRLKSMLKKRTLLVRALRRLRKSRQTMSSIAREIPLLVRCYRSMRGLDFLVIPGSQALHDGWRGPWGHPYTLLKGTLLARLAGARVVCLSIGGGPVNGRLARRFTRRALRLMSYISCRDQSSVEFVRDLGLDPPPVMPDMGFSLPAESFVDPVRTCEPVTSGMRIGLNVMAHDDPRYLTRGNIDSYTSYIRKLADFTRWALGAGHDVVLLYSQIQADPKACLDLCKLLRSEYGAPPNAALSHGPIKDYKRLTAMMGACDVIVASRFHCIVLPFILAKPVVSTGYHVKHFDLMESMGQSDYALDIDQFAAPQLIERVENAFQNRRSIEQCLRGRVNDCRSRLRAQFDALFGPLHRQFKADETPSGALFSSDCATAIE